MLDVLSKPDLALAVAVGAYIVALIYLGWRLKEVDRLSHLFFEFVLFTFGLVAAGLACIGSYGYEGRLAGLKRAWVNAQATMSADRKKDVTMARSLSARERAEEDRFEAFAHGQHLEALAGERRVNTALSQATKAEAASRNAAALVTGATQQAIAAEKAAEKANRQYLSLKGSMQRHLTVAQVNAFTSAFAGSNEAVSVWRCVSSESAITLMYDFIEAFQRAGMKIETGGVSTECLPGVKVTVNPNDSETINRLLNALTRARIKFYGVQDSSIKVGTFTILIGEKTANSP